MTPLALQFDTPGGPATVAIPPDRPLVIGRDPGCDVVFDDATVSRRHCELLARDGQVWLRHLSATNATYLNGRIALGVVGVRAGDVLRLPVVELRVVEPEAQRG